MTDPILLQRLEGAALAALAATLFVLLAAPWWWLLAAFLVFDLSAIGYLAGPRAGAATYNAVHAFVGPAALGVVAALTQGDTIELVALAWSFHVGVDRALGYGLKHGSSFRATHLGTIGRPAR